MPATMAGVLGSAIHLIVARIALQDWTVALRSPMIQTMVDGSYEDIVGTLARFIHRYQEAGYIDGHIDPAVVGRFFPGTCQGHIV